MRPEQIITAMAHLAITIQVVLAVATLVAAFVERKSAPKLFSPLVIMGLGFLVMGARRLTAVLLKDRHADIEILDRGVLPLVISFLLLLGVTMLIRSVVTERTRA